MLPSGCHCSRRHAGGGRERGDGYNRTPGEPVPLAEAICLMLRNPQMRQSFGRRGRELVEAEFDQAKQIRETADLYRLGLSPRRRWFDHPIHAESAGEPAPKSTDGSPVSPLQGAEGKLWQIR